VASQLRFGPFRADVGDGALFLSGARIAIQRQPFALLALLLEKPGEIVTRDELRARLWPDGTVVDFERALNTTVRKLRRSLRDSAAHPRFVETLPQRGYRLVAPVEAVHDEAASSVDRTPALLVAKIAASEAADDAALLRHRWLSDAVEAHRVRDLRWMEDGLVARFASTADAVRAAIALEQAAHLLDARGASLRIALVADDGDGTQPDERADALCEVAAPGRILCAADLAGALAGNDAFRLRALGSPANAYELVVDPDRAVGLLARAPFVGRDGALARVAAALAKAEAGEGRIVFVTGEPGIGKTRFLEELAARARATGAQVIGGAAREGALGRPFGPFAEALAAWSAGEDPAALRDALSRHASVVAELVPELRDRLPDLADAPRLAPDDQRARVLDAAAQAFWSASQRKPLVLLLDDLHWADAATVTLLRHLARFVERHRVLIVGAFRDAELDREHTLHDALAAFAAQGVQERIDLRGLESTELAQLVDAIAPGKGAPIFVAALGRETQGNPFFVREILLSLLEEGKLGDEHGEILVPASVRQVVRGRLGRLSDTAQRLLAAAAACERGFDFAAAAAAADLDEGTALDGLDEALEAQIVRATTVTDRYEFGHALIRHAIYDALSAARRMRLHRRLAEALASRPRRDEHAFEIARHFQCSADLPGAERGADYALVAAERAERAGAFDEAAAALRFAAALLPVGDARSARVAARLGMALLLGNDRDEGARAAIDAARAIAASEGDAAAAEYVAAAVTPLQMWSGRGQEHAWRIAEEAMRYTGDRRDLPWAILVLNDLDRRSAEAPDHLGTIIDSPERREAWSLLTKTWRDSPGAALRRSHTGMIHERWGLIESRAEAIADWADDSEATGMWAGDYTRAIELCDRYDAMALEHGHLQHVAATRDTKARYELALGDVAAALRTADAAAEIGERAGIERERVLRFFLLDYLLVRREGVALLAARIEKELADLGPGARWMFAPLHVAAGLGHAALGNVDAALGHIAAATPVIERTLRGFVINTGMMCSAARALWEVDRSDHAEVIERNLRTKVLAGDLRFPQVDARLAVAQLCALTGRYDESRDWFARARIILDEQGARPLRAIVDYDEALALRRRDARGDRARARPLVEAARVAFEAIGMPGWLAVADRLARELG
jgi:DNA-binding winged helix-turn-helix (wHTH) protein